MVVRNDLDRFHLVRDVIDRVPGLGSRAAALRQQMVDARVDARAYAREHGDDPARSGTGPGRTERGGVRVLVLNAGSSSLKVSVLEPPTGTPCATARLTGARMRPGHPAGARPSRASSTALARTAWPPTRSTPSDIASSTAEAGSPRRPCIDECGRRGDRGARHLAPLHNAVGARDDPCGPRSASRDPPRGLLRHRIPRRPATSRLSLPGPGRLVRDWGIRRFGFHGLSVAWSTERAAGAARPAGRGSPPDRGPSGQRVLGHRGRCREVRRNLDGDDSARGADDGDALRLGRPGHHARSAAARPPRPDRAGGRAGSRIRSARRVGPVSRRSRAPAAEAKGDAASGLALELFVRRAAAGIAVAATSFPHSTRWCSPAASANTPVRSEAIVERLAVLWVRGVTDEPVAADAVLTAGRVGLPSCGWQRAEDVVIAEGVRGALEAR